MDTSTMAARHTRMKIQRLGKMMKRGMRIIRMWQTMEARPDKIVIRLFVYKYGVRDFICTQNVSIVKAMNTVTVRAAAIMIISGSKKLLMEATM